MLRQYLEEVDDLDLRYQLAMEVGMYDLALETLRTLKDGERVRAFINYLPPVKHPEFRRKVDQLLSNSVSPSNIALGPLLRCHLFVPPSKSSGRLDPHSPNFLIFCFVVHYHQNQQFWYNNSGVTNRLWVKKVVLINGEVKVHFVKRWNSLRVHVC